MCVSAVNISHICCIVLAEKREERTVIDALYVCSM